MKDLKNIMVALDNMNQEEIFQFLKSSKGNLPTIKIGLENFCKYGPEFIKKIHQEFQSEIFLDLKLHDIPNTVRKSVLALEGLPIQFLTIHISGGREMIEAACQAAKEVLPNTKILGVSFLTSLDQKDFSELFGLEQNQIQAAFERLFQLALSCPLHGLVLSAQELEVITELETKFQKKILKVCPGIRFLDEIASNNIGDQKRVLDPKEAFSQGADYLVIGRSLTQAQDLTKRIEQLEALL